MLNDRIHRPAAGINVGGIFDSSLDVSAAQSSCETLIRSDFGLEIAAGI